MKLLRGKLTELISYGSGDGYGFGNGYGYGLDDGLGDGLEKI